MVEQGQENIEMKIKKAVRVLDKVPYINNGGCLVATYAMHLVYKKLGLKNKLQMVAVYREGCPKEYETNNLAFIEGQATKASAASHFVWTTDSGATFQDIYGQYKLRDSDEITIIHYKMARRFFLAAINNGYWNDWFHRSYIPKIEKKLEISMGKVNKRTKYEGR